MIYTVECAFTDPAREDEWNRHYSGEKLDNLLRLPGWTTSQRFRALTPIDAPYFAMHTLTDADVLGATYTSVGGGVFGGWEGSIANWHRNLFKGLDVAPDVTPEQRLVLATDPTAGARFPTLGFAWLEACGLDRSVALLGLAVVAKDAGDSLAAGFADTLRVYEPIMPRKISGRETAT